MDILANWEFWLWSYVGVIVVNLVLFAVLVLRLDEFQERRTESAVVVAIVVASALWFPAWILLSWDEENTWGRIRITPYVLHLFGVAIGLRSSLVWFNEHGT